MSLSKTIILFLLFYSFKSWSNDYLMFIGAGGEAGKNDTIFDESIKNLGAYIKRSEKLVADIALDGGHSTTEEIIQESFPASTPKTNFLESDYKHLIEKYKLKLQSNEMKAGDQFMIYIDSHGAKKEDKYKTHRIATSSESFPDLGDNAGSRGVDLDQLEVLKNLAKEKGVKMAIIDSSCHSGNTHALADNNTCVISATGPNHYGYRTFGENFTSAMAKGKNLEEIFLETRAKDETPNYPMISTMAGKNIYNQIYEILTPYLYYFDPDNDKLLPYLIEKNDQTAQCIANLGFESLISSIKLIEELNVFANEAIDSIDKKSIFSDLKLYLQEYKKSQDLIRESLRKLNLDRLNKMESIKASYTSGLFTFTAEQDYSWEELINADFKSLIKKTKNQIDTEKNENNLSKQKLMLSLYSNAQAKKDEVLKNNPDLDSIIQKEEKIKKLIESNYFTASDIATEERKLYSALYNQYTPIQNEQNPCKAFKL